MEDGSSSIDFLRRIVARFGHYRHFPAISTDHAFHFIDCYLLGTGFAALSQLALSSPLFRPHHTKLGKQRRRAAQGKVFRYRHDDLFLPIDVLAISRTLVDRCHIITLLQLRGCVDVVTAGGIKLNRWAFSLTCFLFSHPIYPLKQSVRTKTPYSTLIFQTASMYSIKCKF